MLPKLFILTFLRKSTCVNLFLKIRHDVFKNISKLTWNGDKDENEKNPCYILGMNCAQKKLQSFTETSSDIHPV